MSELRTLPWECPCGRCVWITEDAPPTKCPTCLREMPVLRAVGWEKTAYTEGRPTTRNDVIRKREQTRRWLAEQPFNVEVGSIIYHRVELTYFKRSGKYYTNGDLTVTATMYHTMISAVKDVFRSGRWPGLCEGDHDFVIHCVCTTEEFSVPFLLFPEELR